MIKGYYQQRVPNIPPAPYVQAVVLCPKVSVVGSVRFLVDTGADITSLSPGDTEIMGFTEESLKGETKVEMGGLGNNPTSFYSVESKAVFGSPASYMYVWLTHILVYDIWGQDLGDTARQMPSLLGRDFLHQCRITASGFQGILQLLPTPSGNLTALPPVPGA